MKTRIPTLLVLTLFSLLNCSESPDANTGDFINENGSQPYPLVSILSGPQSDISTNSPFTVCLSVDNDNGYFSTNSSDFYSFGRGKKYIYIGEGLTSLSYFGFDGEDSSPTNELNFTVSSSSLTGNTYYVSPAGSDSDDGSDSTPWKTLDHSFSRLAPGDTLIIRAGNYGSEWSGYISLQNSGSPNGPISVQAYPGEQVVLSNLQLTDIEWVRIEGIVLAGPFQPTLPDMPSVQVDDAGISIDPNESWSTREGKVRDKYATYMDDKDRRLDQWAEGISINNSAHITIRNCRISNQTAGIMISGESRFIDIISNEVHHCMVGIYGWSESEDDAVSAYESRAISNYCHQNLSEGIYFRNGRFLLYEYNFCEYNGQCHIMFQKGTSDSIMRYNRVQYGGYYSEAMEWPGSSAINIHTAGANNRIDGNYAAYQYDDTLNDGNGVIVDYTPDGAVIRNNVFYRNMGSGITTTWSGNSDIINNTCVENGYNTPDAWNGAAVRFAKEGDTNNLILNNIFVSNKVCGVYGYRLLEAQRLIDYNLYAEEMVMWGGWATNSNDQRYSNLTELRANTSCGDHSLEGNPQFTVYASGDYSLQAGSPALDAGSVDYAPDTDFNGNPRDANPDMGAFED